jgi:hypothetical protein
LDHQRRLGADPDFDASYSGLYDLSQVEQLAVTSAGTRSVAFQLPWGPGARRAVVAPDDLAYGMTRMLQGLSRTAEQDDADSGDPRECFGVCCGHVTDSVSIDPLPTNRLTRNPIAVTVQTREPAFR